MDAPREETQGMQRILDGVKATTILANSPTELKAEALESHEALKRLKLTFWAPLGLRARG